MLFAIYNFPTWNDGVQSSGLGWLNPQPATRSSAMGGEKKLTADMGALWMVSAHETTIETVSELCDYQLSGICNMQERHTLHHFSVGKCMGNVQMVYSMAVTRHVPHRR